MESDQDSLVDKFRDLLLEFREIPIPKKERTFMEIAGYPHYENVASNILQFFLNPHNEHGLGSLVLRSLIQVGYPEIKLPLDFEDVEVSREIGTKNGKRLDLLIKSSDFMIGIENKIYHHLNNDLEEYSEMIHSKSVNKQNVKVIKYVLAPNKYGFENLGYGFVSITYKELFDSIKAKIGKHIESANQRYLSILTDFMTSIQNLNSIPMESKKMWRFFDKNENNVNDLIEAKKNIEREIERKIIDLQNIIDPKPNWLKSSKPQEGWLHLTHSYSKIEIEAFLGFGGWTIKIFGDNATLQPIFAGNQSYLNYEKGDRVYQRIEEINDLEAVCLKLQDIQNTVDRLFNNSTID